MNKTVYEILESFVPFEKLKKCKSSVHLKPPNVFPKPLILSRSSITFTNSQLPSDRKNQDPIDLMELKAKKQSLLAQLARIQFKAMELGEKEKEKDLATRNFKVLEEKLKKKEKELLSNKKKQNEELKCLENSFVSKIPELVAKKMQAEELKKILSDKKQNFERVTGDILTKKGTILEKLDEMIKKKNEIVESLKTNLQEQETFKKTHNILDVKEKIKRADYQTQVLLPNFAELKTIVEEEEKKKSLEMKKLANELTEKTNLIEKMSCFQNQRDFELNNEIEFLAKEFEQRNFFLENLKEAIKKQKASFLKEFKEADDQKLRLFREMASIKEIYDSKSKKFIEFSRQKTTQISHQKLSTVDLEVEEMRESKRILKTTFELQMREVLAKRDTLRIENNSFNENHQNEMLKKSIWNMKLNRFHDEKRLKTENQWQNLEEASILKAAKDQLSQKISELEFLKSKITEETNKIRKGNEEMRRYLDSVSDLRADIDDKKRERQWFADIKKEISSQKEALVKKIKEMKKFKEKTQKELDSQKQGLSKFQEKINKLEKIYEDLERKKSNFA